MIDPINFSNKQTRLQFDQTMINPKCRHIDVKTRLQTLKPGFTPYTQNSPYAYSATHTQHAPYIQNLSVKVKHIQTSTNPNITSTNNKDTYDKLLNYYNNKITYFENYLSKLNNMDESLDQLTSAEQKEKVCYNTNDIKNKYYHLRRELDLTLRFYIEKKRNLIMYGDAYG